MAQENWQAYEEQVHRGFTKKYPELEICLNQKLTGRYSKVARQVDVLVKAKVAESEWVGVFDCKHFHKKIDVIVIDMMVGFMTGVGTNFGGGVSSIGFTSAAQNRANIPGMSGHLGLTVP